MFKFSNTASLKGCIYSQNLKQAHSQNGANEPVFWYSFLVSVIRFPTDFPITDTYSRSPCIVGAVLACRFNRKWPARPNPKPAIPKVSQPKPRLKNGKK